MVIQMYIFLQSSGVGGGKVLEILNTWFIHLFIINSSVEILLGVVVLVEIKESGNQWAMMVIVTLVYVRHPHTCDSQMFAWVLRGTGNCSGVGFGERIVRIKKMHISMKISELLGMGSWQVDDGGEWSGQGSILRTQWEVIKFISGPFIVGYERWNKPSSARALITRNQHHKLWKILIFESSIPIQSEVLFWIFDFPVCVCITRIDMHKLNVFIALIVQMGLAKDVCHATASIGGQRK